MLKIKKKIFLNLSHYVSLLISLKYRSIWFNPSKFLLKFGICFGIRILDLPRRFQYIYVTHLLSQSVQRDYSEYKYRTCISVVLSLREI